MTESGNCEISQKSEMGTFICTFCNCEAIGGFRIVLLTRESINMMCANFSLEAKTYRNKYPHHWG